MALSESDAVHKTLIARTIGEEQEFPMSRMAQSTIPSGVKAYLRAHLRDRFQEEISRYGPFARVQPISPSSSQLHELFFAHAAEGYVYPRSEFLEDLENAAYFTENYVCRPRWTLSSFLFHGVSKISDTTLYAKLEYVTEYVYLPQLLRRMVAQRQIPEIEAGVCSLLIRQIDAAVVREHTPRELALLARPIFDYFLYGAPEPTRHIPLKPILLFLKDKELHALRDHIQGVCLARDREHISLTELVDFCEEYLSRPPSPAPATPELEHSVPVQKPGYELPVQEDNGHDTGGLQQSGQAAPDGAAAPVMTSVEAISQYAHPPLDKMITPEQRRRFITVLCDRDADFYELILSRLNIMRTWNEASAYIRELFEINSVDPYRDEAITFTDIVQHRFSLEAEPQP
jgi:hypothetical protein